MTAPWTPRERSLRAALEKVNDALCVTSPLAIARGVAEAFSIINSALSDVPPPDQRDEALNELLAAQEAWEAACHWDAHERPSTPEGYTEGCKRLKETQQRREAAYVAAIRAAKGGA